MPAATICSGLQKMNGGETKGTILHEWDKAVDDAAEAGIKYMVCAYLFPDERGSIDHYQKKWLASLIRLLKDVRKPNSVCYHNPRFLNLKLKWRVAPIIYSLNETDKDLVKWNSTCTGNKSGTRYGGIV